MNSRAAAFGERLARTLGKGPSSASLGAQERAVMVAVRQHRERRRSILLGTLPSPARLALALGVAAVLVLGLVAFSVDRSAREATLLQPTTGARVATDVASSETLTFSDGSTVVVRPNSSIELTRVEQQWTEVGLERGRLELDIQRRRDAHFAVTAGPYRVVVVGTRFQVVFDDKLERLTVSVGEGQVRVFGAGLPKGGKPVSAGARFEHSGKTPARHGVSQAPAPTAASPADTRAPADVKPQGTPRSSGLAAVTWQELAKRGQYSDAYALAEQQGFEAIVNGSAADDLLMLANCARFTGKAGQARRAFLELRERFSGRPEAVLASFYLARIALDSERNSAAAARWLRTYLREAPNGQLAAGARVDLMNILLGQGDHAAARRVAEDYLKHHPDGTHAGVARSLLERAGSGP